MAAGSGLLRLFSSDARWFKVATFIVVVKRPLADQVAQSSRNHQINNFEVTISNQPKPIDKES